MHSVGELSLVLLSFSVGGVLAGVTQVTSNVATPTTTVTTTTTTTSTIGTLTGPTETSIITEPIISSTTDVSAAPIVTSCVPKIEVYVCEDDDSYELEYATTFTVYPSGCPSSTYNPDYPITTASPDVSSSSAGCDDDENPTTSKGSGSSPTAGSSSSHSSGPAKPSPSNSAKDSDSEGYGTLSTTVSKPSSSGPSGAVPTTTPPGKGASPTGNGSSGPTKSTTSNKPQFTGASSKKAVDGAALVALGIVGVLAAM